MAIFQSLEEARAFFVNDRYATENGIVLDEVVNGALLAKYPKALEKLLTGLAPEASGS